MLLFGKKLRGLNKSYLKKLVKHENFFKMVECVIKFKMDLNKTFIKIYSLLKRQFQTRQQTPKITKQLTRHCVCFSFFYTWLIRTKSKPHISECQVGAPLSISICRYSCSSLLANTRFLARQSAVQCACGWKGESVSNKLKNWVIKNGFKQEYNFTRINSWRNATTNKKWINIELTCSKILK